LLLKGSGQTLGRKNGEADADMALQYKDPKERALLEFKHRYLSYHLSECRGNISQTARNMGLERQALQQIKKCFGIRKSKPDDA
jgi:DNA-binding NtrC family response regulator